MTHPLQFFAVAGSILLLPGARFLWMCHKARRAIRRELVRMGVTPGKIRRESVWREFDSIREACSVMLLDFKAGGIMADGSEQSFWFVADFVPILGWLRDISLCDWETASGLVCADLSTRSERFQGMDSV